MTTILLARHGESDWNAERRWQGHADRPLTARGRAQATRLGARLDGVPLDAVYASDLRRARDTAAVVAERRGARGRGSGRAPRGRLGSWAGLTNAELDPVEVRTVAPRGNRMVQDGESYELLPPRLLGAIFAIAALHPDDQCSRCPTAGHPGGRSRPLPGSRSTSAAPSPGDRERRPPRGDRR